MGPFRRFAPRAPCQDCSCLYLRVAWVALLCSVLCSSVSFHFIFTQALFSPRSFSGDSVSSTICPLSLIPLPSISYSVRLFFSLHLSNIFQSLFSLFILLLNMPRSCFALYIPAEARLSIAHMAICVTNGGRPGQSLVSFALDGTTTLCSAVLERPIRSAISPSDVFSSKRARMTLRSDSVAALVLQCSSKANERSCLCLES